VSVGVGVGVGVVFHRPPSQGYGGQAEAQGRKGRRRDYI
jgi:hypothetical protein